MYSKFVGTKYQTAEEEDVVDADSLWLEPPAISKDVRTPSIKEKIEAIVKSIQTDAFRAIADQLQRLLLVYLEFTSDDRLMNDEHSISQMLQDFSRVFNDPHPPNMRSVTGAYGTIFRYLLERVDSLEVMRLEFIAQELRGVLTITPLVEVVMGYLGFNRSKGRFQKISTELTDYCIRMTWLTFIGARRHVSFSELVVCLTPFYAISVQVKQEFLQFLPQLLSLCLAGRVVSESEMNTSICTTADFDVLMKRWGGPLSLPYHISSLCLADGSAFQPYFQPFCSLQQFLASDQEFIVRYGSGKNDFELIVRTDDFNGRPKMQSWRILAVGQGTSVYNHASEFDKQSQNQKSWEGWASIPHLLWLHHSFRLGDTLRDMTTWSKRAGACVNSTEFCEGYYFMGSVDGLICGLDWWPLRGRRR